MGLFKSITSIFSPPQEEPLPRSPGRNDDCWCGSGRKYKKCHLEDDEKKLRSQYTANCGKT